MTKKDLENLRGLPADIAQRKRQIERLEKEIAAAPNVIDCVQGSSAAPAFALHAIQISGYDVGREHRKDRLLMVLHSRQAQCELLQAEAIQFIESIDDAMLRAAVRGYYMEGLTWNQIADEIPNATEDSIRMIVKRFLEKF